MKLTEQKQVVHLSKSNEKQKLVVRQSRENR